MIIIIYPDFSQQVTLQEFLSSHGISDDIKKSGYDQFKTQTWYPTFDIMKYYNYIDCGYKPDIMNRTTSFAVIFNRIFQFKLTLTERFLNRRPEFNLHVIMYDNIRERYLKKEQKLSIYGGFTIGVNQLIPVINNMGNFHERLSCIFETYSYERLKVLTTSLIWRQYIGFKFLVRMHLCANHFWYVSEFSSTIDGCSFSDDYHYDYQSLPSPKSYHLIPISFDNIAINIVHEYGQNDIKVLDFNLTTQISKLCYGKQSTHLLKQITTMDNCVYHEQYQTMSDSLISLFESFEYGFTIITDLILVSKEKNLVLIIDKNILHTVNKEFPFRIKMSEDFFNCDSKETEQ